MSQALLRQRLARRLAWQKAVNDPVRDPRNRLPQLQALQAWQARRLSESFTDCKDNARRRPAAEFFLTDLYGERDFSGRDRDVAKVMPMMSRLLPDSLLVAAADAIGLAVLSHAFDLRMAQVLETLAPKRKRLDDALYGEAYRACGLPRLRSYQIDLIARVGKDLGRGLKLPGVGMLLKLSRGPATAAGLAELHRFLERGVDAFLVLFGSHDTCADFG